MRAENDIVRAILLGYALIATQKLQKAETTIAQNKEGLLVTLMENQKNISEQFTKYNLEDPTLFEEMIKAKSVDNKKNKQLYPIKIAPFQLKDQLSHIGFDLDLDIYKKSPKKMHKKFFIDSNEFSGKPKKTRLQKAFSLGSTLPISLKFCLTKFKKHP